MFYAGCAAYGVLLDGKSYLLAFEEHSSHSTTSAEEIGPSSLSSAPHPKLIFLPLKFLNTVDVVAKKVPANSPLSRLPHLAFSFGRGLQGVAVQK
ncbi:hypothetical protein BDR05DRAFT_1060503 [Suillus weaverae]|nr:hypothetical protein BDR05DRAFT_1060503 [Suillus weaverae]